MIVGYSNGGTLALDYTLRAMDDPDLPVPDRVILISPAMGITPFAALGQLHGLLSFLPCFEKFQWQDVYPEFDPYKYNSFPKNGGYQEHRLIKSVKRRINKRVHQKTTGDVPPIITFQSVVDDTVIVEDLVADLYGKFNDAKHELVLFDINHQAEIQDLIQRDRKTVNSELCHYVTNRKFRLTLLSNSRLRTDTVYEYTYLEFDEPYFNRPDLHWPPGIHSLSHVALPFAPDDPLYGDGSGDPPESGIRLGILAPRGERNVLLIPIKNMMRLRYNPFFDYIRRRIREVVSV